MKYPFPMIDLHLHLDGAIEPKTLMELARERGISLPADTLEAFIPYVVVDPSCRSVNEYLEKFELPTRILQDRDALVRVSRELVERLSEQGLAYAEIRFAPQLHIKNGMTQREAVTAVIDGIRKGKEGREIEIGLILCAMSLGDASLNRKENLETVSIAEEFLQKGVDAIDLAGAEGLCPLSDFIDIFDLARELKIPYTCHAGDSQGPNTVRTAIVDFGSRRIGHGHHIFDDPELCNMARDLGVTLEICLTSNIQCETQPSYKEHPAKKLLEMGIAVTLNTDNPEIAGVTLESEYDVALEQAGFTKEDLIRMNLNSAKASFLPKDKKEKLIAKLKTFQE